MPTGIWTFFLLSFAVAATVAWLVALMHERGISPLRRFWAFMRRQPKVGQVLLGTFFIAMWVIAGTKPGGGRGATALPEGECSANSAGRDGLVAPNGDEWADFASVTSTNTARTLTADDFARGFVMHRAGTGEAFDFSVPPGATVCADWEAFGAAEDWFHLSFTNWAFRVGADEVNRFRVFSFGQVDLLADLQTPAETGGGRGATAIPKGECPANSAGCDVPVAPDAVEAAANAEPGRAVAPRPPRLWPLRATLGVVPRRSFAPRRAVRVRHGLRPPGHGRRRRVRRRGGCGGDGPAQLVK